MTQDQRTYWDGMVPYGVEAAVIDPNDRRGHKNAYIKYVRDQELSRFAASLPASSRILDFGCGTGNVCRLLSQHRQRAVGVDISSGLLRLADRQRDGNRFDLVRYDGWRLPLADASVDAVVTYVALSHVLGAEQFAHVVNELARVLRPGAQCLLIEPTVRRAAVVPSGLQIRRSAGDYATAFARAGLTLTSSRPIRMGHFPPLALIRLGVVPRQLFPLVSKLEQLVLRAMPRPPLDYVDTVLRVAKDSG